MSCYRAFQKHVNIHILKLKSQLTIMVFAAVTHNYLNYCDNQQTFKGAMSRYFESFV